MTIDFDSPKFDEAIEFLFQDEGGEYTDDPNDAGGPTKWGVTLKAYQDFMGRPITADNIRALTSDSVKPFYYAKYWQPLQCELIASDEIAIAVFDTGVLYGVQTSAFLAQQALDGIIGVDGIIGNATLSALNGVDPKTFLTSFVGKILARISVIINRNSNDEKYRKGWAARAERLLNLV